MNPTRLPHDQSVAVLADEPPSLAVDFLRGLMDALAVASASSLPRVLQQVLGLIGGFTRTDRIGLLRVDDNPESEGFELEWVSSELALPAEVELVALADHPGLVRTFRSGEIAWINNTEQVDDLSAPGHPSLRSLGITSNAVIPLVLGRDLLGLLLLDDYDDRKHRDWVPLLPTLSVVGHAISIALGRHDSEHRRSQSEQRSRSLFDDNPLPAFTVAREDLRILEANEAACDRYGPRSDLTKRTLSSLHPLEERALLDGLDQVEPDERCGPWHHRLPSGSITAVELSVRGGRFGDRDVLHCVVYDVTERDRIEAQLRHNALHDSLTGLGNRALLEQQLTDLLGRSASVAVLILDLDGFKIVNDSLGHAAGDDLLIEAADRLRKAVRERDTVVRLGGDEFAILVDGQDANGLARTLAERAIRALAEPFDLSGVDAVVSASIGMSFTPAALYRTTDAETMLRNADLAMYAAKDAGRGRLVEFSERLSQAASERLRLVADLQRAFRKDQLRLHYQPIVALDSMRVLGVEALLRWQHPELGMVAPGQYLPLIEDTPLIGKLGAWVLNEACRQLRLWSDELVEPPAIAINVAPQQLRDVEFVDSIRLALTRHNVEASKLIIEITERSLIDDADAVGRLQSLRDLGLRLSIDDFGTCYAALGYLRKLPVDILKIDRTFIAALEHEPARSTATVAAITDFANVLGVETMAEGIELNSQRALLQDMGCFVGQGYLFAKPAPAEEISAYLHAHAG